VTITSLQTSDPSLTWSILMLLRSIQQPDCRANVYIQWHFGVGSVSGSPSSLGVAREVLSLYFSSANRSRMPSWSMRCTSSFVRFSYLAAVIGQAQSRDSHGIHGNRRVECDHICRGRAECSGCQCSAASATLLSQCTISFTMYHFFHNVPLLAQGTTSLTMCLICWTFVVSVCTQMRCGGGGAAPPRGVWGAGGCRPPHRTRERVSEYENVRESVCARVRTLARVRVCACACSCALVRACVCSC
jgi:hypothetical protein